MWSFITVARGLWSVTERMLNSLVATCEPGLGEIEIVYLDNGSPSPSSYESFLQWQLKYPKIPARGFKIDHDVSLGSAWNFGIGRRRAEMVAGENYIVLVNNDVTFLQAGWQQALFDALSREGVGVTGLNGMSWNIFNFIQGSFLAFKESTLDVVGPFDESFEFTCEDVDWCYRANTHGYTLATLESLNGVCIMHHDGTTRHAYGEEFKRHLDLLAAISRLRLCHKWNLPLTCGD